MGTHSRSLPLGKIPNTHVWDHRAIRWRSRRSSQPTLRARPPRRWLLPTRQYLASALAEQEAQNGRLLGAAPSFAGTAARVLQRNLSRLLQAFMWSAIPGAKRWPCDEPPGGECGAAKPSAAEHSGHVGSSPLLQRPRRRGCSACSSRRSTRGSARRGNGGRRSWRRQSRRTRLRHASLSLRRLI